MNLKNPRRKATVLAVAPVLVFAVATVAPAMAATASRIALPNPNPPDLTSETTGVTPLDPATQLALRVYLAPQAGLAAAATSVSDPHSPSYDHFLTSAQALRQFGPSAATATAVPMTDEPLTGPTDIALMLGVPVSWVYANAEAGQLPSFKVGHYRRFRRSDIEEYLRTCRTTPTAR